MRDNSDNDIKINNNCIKNVHNYIDNNYSKNDDTNVT